jgi:hypothetical protein
MVEIARIASVSLATTSRTLNNAPGVAAATRERVLAVAVTVPIRLIIRRSTAPPRTTGTSAR